MTLDELLAIFGTLGGLAGIAAIVIAIVNAFKTAADIKVTAKKTDIDSLREVIANLQSENQRLYERLEIVENDNAKLREGRIKRIQRIDELEAASQRKDMEIATLRAEVAVLREKVKKLEIKTGPLDPGKVE